MADQDARDLAARYWLGYGRWDAPYWFVGMEPGGEDDLAWYETWRVLDPEQRGLIDCRDHHQRAAASDPRAVTPWHQGSPKHIQDTWGPLIRTLLTFEGRPATDLDVARYQRDEWGNLHGDSALIELSGLRASGLAKRIARKLYRRERIGDIRSHLDRKAQRGFALFYGLTYKKDYAEIAGSFGSDGYVWNGQTLCVLVVHPAYHYASSDALAVYWVELAAWLRAAVEAGPVLPLLTRPPLPPISPRRRPRARAPRDSSAVLEAADPGQTSRPVSPRPRRPDAGG
jgi:hypothetical protein